MNEYGNTNGEKKIVQVLTYTYKASARKIKSPTENAKNDHNEMGAVCFTGGSVQFMVCSKMQNCVFLDKF